MLARGIKPQEGTRLIEFSLMAGSVNIVLQLCRIACCFDNACSRPQPYA